MFDILLALFGGTYIASRVGIEKLAHKSASMSFEIEYKRDRENYERWLSSVVDEELEYTLKRDYNKSFEEIIDDINGLELYPPISSFCDYLIASGRAEFKGKWEFKIPDRIMLAKRGKILKHDAENGIHSPGIWDYPEKQRWIRHHKFMMWLDKELQSHGVEPMFFVDGIRAKFAWQTGEGQPLSMVKEPIGGYYFWKSGVRFMHLI